VVYMVAILLSLILSISSFASLQDCVVSFNDEFTRNYSYPRDVFYVSINIQTVSFLDMTQLRGNLQAIRIWK